MSDARPTSHLWCAVPPPPPLRDALRFFRWNGLWIEWGVDWSARTPEQVVTPGYQPPMQIVRVLTEPQYHEALMTERTERIGRAAIFAAGAAE